MGEIGVSHSSCVGLRCLVDCHVMKTVLHGGTVVKIVVWILDDDVTLLVTWNVGSVGVSGVGVYVFVGPVEIG